MNVVRVVSPTEPPSALTEAAAGSFSEIPACLSFQALRYNNT